MRNRAKCKLCESIIESFHSGDYVLCKCGEISLDGGEALRCAAKDWNNFLRVDDQGNTIIVTTKDDVKQLDNGSKPNRQELIDMLDEMAKGIERLPSQAQFSSCTQSDLWAALVLIASVFKAKE